MYTDGVCQTDPSAKPVLNCSKLMADSGGAVQEEERSMIQALHGLKTTSKAVGSSVEEAIEGFTDDQKTWDSCMETYNMSLGAYSACAAVLETLKAELAQLEKNCSSVQPVPATCPDLIAGLLKKIVSQNASCVAAWAGATAKREMLLRAEAEVLAPPPALSLRLQICRKRMVRMHLLVRTLRPITCNAVYASAVAVIL